MRSDYTPAQRQAYHEGHRIGKELGPIDATQMEAMLQPTVRHAFHDGFLDGIEQSPQRGGVVPGSVTYYVPSSGAIDRMSHMEHELRRWIDRVVLAAALIAWVIGLVSLCGLLWVLWRAIGSGG